jgi:hypothetical protein
VTPFLQTLKEYPPSQRVGSFSIDQMREALERSVSAPTGGKKAQRISDRPSARAVWSTSRTSIAATRDVACSGNG